MRTTTNPAKITLKGSKSITNRILILAYLAGSKTKLENTGQCEDTFYMLRGLKKLSSKNPGTINLGNAGTAVRFLTSVAAISGKEVTITGGKRMRSRPIKPLVDALKSLGVKIECSKTGCPPVKISASSRPDITCPLTNVRTLEIPGNISSQYLTSLLLIAPFLKKGLTINLKGEIFSKPYIKMTIGILKKFGIKVDHPASYRTLKVRPGQKITQPKSLFIEGDASSASYLGAYAALSPGKTISIENIPHDSIQGDIAFISYLRKMGCKTSHKNLSIEIKGPGPKTLKHLKPLGTIDMNETPDLVPTFAVLATLAPGTTKITNIANLRIKESDRISALETNLKRLGVKVRTGKDFIEITGESPETFIKRNSAKKLSINTYNDHRIAMAFGVLKKTILPRLRIEKPSVVRKSYPEF
ncbi:3-phosphoshikimate 1-carboxyvinyltransferase, partial [Patescibacteria group bacterium]|nr:3-phosphoshikimate 1-carboxyvinyltransferase [Patescibacteria group bacterium]